MNKEGGTRESSKSCLHHELQRYFYGEWHIGMTQDEGLVHVLVNPAARILCFGRYNTVRYEASAACCWALAVAIACVDSPHAQAAVGCDFDVKRMILGKNHGKWMAVCYQTN